MPTFEVRFDKINVLILDDGPGASDALEVVMHFRANGQSETWKKDLKLGFTDIGISLFVTVQPWQVNSYINVAMYGKEIDFWFDDFLPGFSEYHWQTPTGGWGVGFNSGHGSNAEINYIVSYQIIEIIPAIYVLPAPALLGFVEAAADKKGWKDVADRQLLAWGLNRIERSGWTLVQMRDDEVIFRGAGPFLKRIDDHFGRGVRVHT